MTNRIITNAGSFDQCWFRFKNYLSTDNYWNYLDINGKDIKLCDCLYRAADIFHAHNEKGKIKTILDKAASLFFNKEASWNSLRLLPHDELIEVLCIADKVIKLRAFE